MEREDIEFRVGLARRLVKESSETIEGKKTYMRKAIRMAEELRKKKQVHQWHILPVEPSRPSQTTSKYSEHRVISGPLRYEGESGHLLRRVGIPPSEHRLQPVSYRENGAYAHR